MEFIKEIMQLLNENKYDECLIKCEEKKQIAISKNQYLFDKEELKSFYRDWKIIHYREFKGKLETHNEKIHRHFNVELIAQKI